MGQVTLAVDRFLFDLINVRLQNGFFDWLMPLVSDWRSFKVPLLLAAFCAFVLGGGKVRLTVFLALVAILTSDYLSSSLAKSLFQRARPCQVLQGVRLLTGCSSSSFSFPSSHATNMAAAAVIVGSRYRGWLFPLLLGVFLVAYSRVYVGVHYPLDVVGGGVLGLVVACLVLASESFARSWLVRYRCGYQQGAGKEGR